MQFNKVANNFPFVVLLGKKIGSSPFPPGAFVSRWNASGTVVLPFANTGTFDCIIDWGDSTPPQHVTSYDQATHDYASPGIYTVISQGTMEGFSFGAASAFPEQLIEIQQWGTLKLTGSSLADGFFFEDCSNLTISAVDIPDLTGATSFGSAFKNCSSLITIPNVGSWDTSNIQTFSQCFSGCTLMNAEIGGWSLLSALSVEYMLENCSSFNMPLPWLTPVLETIEGCFKNAILFNQDLLTWTLSSVTTMKSAFEGATAMQGDISNWDVSAVLDMSRAFMNSNFNGDISDWIPSSCITLESTFQGNAQFNVDIGGWSVSQITSLQNTFYNAIAFNKSLNAWNTESLSTIAGAFQGASSYNQPMNNWDANDIGNADSAFKNAIAFDQDLSSWSVGALTSAVDMFDGVTLSTPNYDALLIAWAEQVVQSDVVFGGGNSQYTSAAILSRNTLTNAPNSWVITDGGLVGGADFITVWDTTTDDAMNATIELPLVASGSYLFTVQWGDGNSDVITSYSDPAVSHTYSSPGTYTVTITGTLIGWSFGENYTTPWNLIDITQWGNVQLSDGVVYGGYFYDCYWMTQISALDAPDLTAVTSFYEAFYDCAFTSIANLSAWDVSTITDMTSCFYYCWQFIGTGLNSWDVSNVTTMEGMFENCDVFNTSLSSWTTTSLTSTKNMFHSALAFNQSLQNFDMTQVTTCESMFEGAAAFNGDIYLWSLPSCLNMSKMFKDCTSFNKNFVTTGNWHTPLVQDFSQFLSGATLFNNPLSLLDVGSCVDFSNMLANTSFNQPLPGGVWPAGWDTSQAASFSGLFKGTPFSQDISAWDLSNGPILSEMFRSSGMTIPLTWDVSACSQFDYMFAESAYNANISGWGMSSATTIEGMFYNNTAFNIDISVWDVSNVTNFSRCFAGATAFNKALTWDTLAGQNFESMFEGATAFNSLLLGWNITGASSFPGVSSMFKGCTSLNQSFGTWVTSASNHYYIGMFSGCTALDQDFSSFNVRGLSNAFEMFNGVTLSNANYNRLLTGWAAQVPVASSVLFSGGNSHYDSTSGGVDGVAARAVLTGAPYVWSITDGGTP
jgi:surface protein